MNRILLLLILFPGIFCIGCTGNHEALRLVYAGQGPLPLQYDTIERGPTRLAAARDDMATAVLYYLCSSDSFVKRKRLSDGVVSAVYKLQGTEYAQMAQVTDYFDTVFLFLASGHIIAAANDWSCKYRLPKAAGKTYLFRVDDLAVHKGRVFVQYSVPVPPNFIDKYVDAVMPLYDTTSAVIRYCGAFPKVYQQSIFYYTNADRTFAGEDLYYLFEKSDSLLVYDTGSLELRTVVPVFKDLSRDAADRPYDAVRSRDFVYLKAYITIAECNIRTYQYQVADQLYLVKRLPAEDTDTPVRYVLGKVRDKRYIGYTELPADFDAGRHYFHNDRLYYVSSTEGVWYCYNIEEV